MSVRLDSVYKWAKLKDSQNKVLEVKGKIYWTVKMEVEENQDKDTEANYRSFTADQICFKLLSFKLRGGENFF